ncbi:MAG: glycosyltransferase [Bacteroidales bacterium]
MRILVITDNIGGNAPGIVIERFLCEMSKSESVDALTYEYVKSPDMPSLGNVTVLGQMFETEKIRRRFNTASIKWLGANPADELRKNNALKALRGKSYDIILGCCYGCYLFGLTAGIAAKRRFRVPLVSFFMDAIPSPVGWIEDGLYRHRMERLVTKGLRQADGLLSTNPKMLDYEAGFLPVDRHVGIGGKNTSGHAMTDFVFTPCVTSSLTRIPRAASADFTFLYAGSIYGPRRLDHLLKAFARLIDEGRNVRLNFVGTHDIEKTISGLPNNVQEKITITNRVADLTPYYSQACALVDIDAELPDDVFLSSKITNYVSIDRPVISETGPDSESRRLFKGLKTVIQCGHDAEELHDAMEEVITCRVPDDYSERDSIIKQFSLEENSAKLIAFLKSFRTPHSL